MTRGLPVLVSPSGSVGQGFPKNERSQRRVDLGCRLPGGSASAEFKRHVQFRAWGRTVLDGVEVRLVKKVRRDV